MSPALVISMFCYTIISNTSMTSPYPILGSYQLAVKNVVRARKFSVGRVLKNILNMEVY